MKSGKDIKGDKWKSVDFELIDKIITKKIKEIRKGEKKKWKNVICVGAVAKSIEKEKAWYCVWIVMT